VTFASIKSAVARTYRHALTDATLQAAAALSYYSILSLFPAMILLSAVMAYIPLPNLFSDLLAVVAQLVPSPTAGQTVYSVLIGILGAHLRAWLSFGMVGTLWLVSSAFDEMIEALNMVYGVSDDRPFWKTRLRALLMAVTTAVLLTFAVALTVIGPRAGEWIGHRLALWHGFLFLWPIVRRALAIGFATFALQALYYLGPNIRQKFRDTLPGAVLAVVCSIGLSFLLGIYFRYFANYNRIYGTLAGMMALMTWLYWAYFIFLVGGELNAELAKEAGSMLGTEPKPSAVRRRVA
jgi:membrane protein